MRIFIMTDMEGVAGVANHDDWVLPSSRNYEQGRRIFTLEINAAVQGFYAAGATEILVADAHGAGGINQELLDERVTYQRGFVGPYPFGLEKGFDAVAWVGQHAKSGTPYAHIAHTGWFNVLDYRINGVSVGELGQMAACASSLGVCCIFAAGDQAMTREAADLLPGIETVAVKRGLTPGSGDEYDTQGYRNRNLAAAHLHPVKARELIRAAAERALSRLKSTPGAFGSFTPRPPYRREVSYRPDGATPAHRVFAEHPSDVMALLNGVDTKL
jgi:D-amino peptidase